MKRKQLLIITVMGGLLLSAAFVGLRWAMSSSHPPPPPSLAVPAASTAPAAAPLPVPAIVPFIEPQVQNVPEWIRRWETSQNFEVWDACAAALAEADTVESVEALIQGVFETADWAARVKLAQNLRAVSNPEVLQVMLAALQRDFGRGSPVVGEICAVISRLAQPDTVEALAALHWQAEGQGVTSHKIIRAMAGIRNPAAKRALEKLAANPEAAESLRAAAQAALSAMPPPS